MDRVCQICGDKAQGFNFNALSCESCKSFFRRNVFKYEQYTCRKDGQCLVDMYTRRCCAKCRLNKCLQSGMQKELINCHDRPSRRKRFRQKSSSQSASIDEPGECTNLMDSSQESAVLHSATSILTETEFEQISEILHATLMAKFYDESQFKIIGEITDLIYALNLAELYIRKTILFCKNIAVFEQLQEDDQLILLKNFFTELMLIRIGYVFDVEREAFIVIKDEEKRTAVFIKLKILYQTGKLESFPFAREKLINFKIEVEQDPIIRDLILAQRLFKPRIDTSCPEVIAQQYSKYTYLLERYLEDKYKSATGAKEKMDRLNEIVSKDLAPARQMMESIYFQAGANQLAIVIKEIFDLI